MNPYFNADGNCVHVEEMIVKPVTILEKLLSQFVLDIEGINLMSTFDSKLLKKNTLK